MNTTQIINHIQEIFKGYESRLEKISALEVRDVLTNLVKRTDITFGQNTPVIEYINDKVKFYKEIVVDKISGLTNLAVEKLHIKKYINFDEDEHIIIGFMDDTLVIGQPGVLKPCKISLEGNTIVKNDLTVIGHLYLNAIKVTNLAQFKDDIFVDKDLHVHNDIRIGGKLYVPQFEIEDEFIVDNDFTVHGDLRVDGALSADTIDLGDNLRARKLTLYNPDDEEINTELIVKYDETDDINRLHTEGLYVNAINGIRFDSENDVKIFYEEEDGVLHLTNDTTINGYLRANSIKIGQSDINYDTVTDSIRFTKQIGIQDKDGSENYANLEYDKTKGNLNIGDTILVDGDIKSVDGNFILNTENSIRFDTEDYTDIASISLVETTGHYGIGFEGEFVKMDIDFLELNGNLYTNKIYVTNKTIEFGNAGTNNGVINYDSTNNRFEFNNDIYLDGSNINIVSEGILTVQNIEGNNDELNISATDVNINGTLNHYGLFELDFIKENTEQYDDEEIKIIGNGDGTGSNLNLSHLVDGVTTSNLEISRDCVDLSAYGNNGREIKGGLKINNSDMPVFTFYGWSEDDQQVKNIEFTLDQIARLKELLS